MSASTVAVAGSRGGSVWKTGLLAGGVAAAGNVLLYVVARATGVSFLAYIGANGEPAVIPVIMVIVASVIGALGAAAVKLVLSRLNARGDGVFRVVAFLFLLISFGGPFSTGVDGPTKVALALMHVIAGAVTIGYLSRGASTTRNLS